MRALLATTDILYTRHEWCPSTQYLQPAFKAGKRNAAKTSSFPFDFGKQSHSWRQARADAFTVQFTVILHQ